MPFLKRLSKHSLVLTKKPYLFLKGFRGKREHQDTSPLGRESLEIRVPREVRTSGGEYFGKWGVLREMGSTSGNGEYFGKWGVLREMGSTSGNREYFGN